jgi:transaldolase
MQFFIDSAQLEEIRSAAQWGFIDGVTTNPSLMAKTKQKPEDVIKEICSLINGPISAEVLSLKSEEMIEEGKKWARVHPNVVVKIPMTEEGLKAVKWFSLHQIKTNVTLVFSPNQALLAAKNGATYVSPFIGRLDDIGHDGMGLITEIRTIFDNYGFSTKILAASIRHAQHVRDAAMRAADVATVPYGVFKTLFQHPLTDSGLEKFLSDYKKAYGEKN